MPPSADVTEEICPSPQSMVATYGTSPGPSPDFGSTPPGSVNVATVCTGEAIPTVALTEKPPVAMTAGSLTTTSKEAPPTCPELGSVTETVAVYVPSSRYRCACVGRVIGRAPLTVNVVGADRSPQSTLTDQDAGSGDSSVKLPSVKVAGLFSTAV